MNFLFKIKDPEKEKNTLYQRTMANVGEYGLA
jgi:hypothetical protein